MAESKSLFEQHQDLAIGLRDNVFNKVLTREPSVFLVGAESRKNDSLRHALRTDLESHPRARKVNVFYPEDLFDDLLSGKLGRRYDYDLLQLENFLADSVDSIVILLEGIGAIAELGAFCNHQELSKKLITVVDKRHQYDKSFIMLGPIKHLMRLDRGSVIFSDLQAPSVEALASVIRDKVYKVFSKAEHSGMPDNPISAQDYVLINLFTTESMTAREMAQMIRLASAGSEKDTTLITYTALSMLENERLISVTEGKFEITKAGMDRVKNRITGTKESNQIRASLDNYRIAHLNRVLRRPKMVSA